MEADTPFQYLNESELLDDDPAAVHCERSPALGSSRSETDSVMHSWQAVQAKLNYHMHLQQEADAVSANHVDTGAMEVVISPQADDHAVREHSEVKLTSAINHHVGRSHSSGHVVIGPSIAPASDDIGGEHQDEAGFKGKRSAHYDEYKVLQAMKARMMEEDDADEED